MSELTIKEVMEITESDLEKMSHRELALLAKKMSVAIRDLAKDEDEI